MPKIRHTCGARLSRWTNRFSDFAKYVDTRFDDFAKSFNERLEHLENRIDDLATSVDKRFEQMDKRFERIEDRIYEVNSHLNSQLRWIIGLMAPLYIALIALVVKIFLG